MNKIQRKFVLDLLECEDKLSAWEWDFINNLADNFDERELSEKQNDRLNEIQRKCV